MSTRCNIIIKDSYTSLTFYRHSDGYPSGVAPTLCEFLDLVKRGCIRDNTSQAAGWLIVLGHEEYGAGDHGNDLTKMRAAKDSFSTWKVGAYEPTSGIHGDIEYLYEIDLSAKTLRGWRHRGGEKGAEVTAELMCATAE